MSSSFEACSFTLLILSTFTLETYSSLHNGTNSNAHVFWPLFHTTKKKICLWMHGWSSHWLPYEIDSFHPWCCEFVFIIENTATQNSLNNETRCRILCSLYFSGVTTNTPHKKQTNKQNKISNCYRLVK